jgi:hypothetical protein
MNERILIVEDETPMRTARIDKIKIGGATLCRAVTRSRWGSTGSHPTVGMVSLPMIGVGVSG